jgi:hypothetical protein
MASHHIRLSKIPYQNSMFHLNQITEYIDITGDFRGLFS